MLFCWTLPTEYSYSYMSRSVTTLALIHIDTSTILAYNIMIVYIDNINNIYNTINMYGEIRVNLLSDNTGWKPNFRQRGRDKENMQKRSVKGTATINSLLRNGRSENDRQIHWRSDRDRRNVHDRQIVRLYRQANQHSGPP